MSGVGVGDINRIQISSSDLSSTDCQTALLLYNSFNLEVDNAT